MNPYKILGIKKNATQEEIRKAYIELAKKYHPDHGGDEDKFKEISEAYRILSNEEEKDFYDKYNMPFGSDSYRKYEEFISYIRSYIDEKATLLETIEPNKIIFKLKISIRNLQKENKHLKRIIRFLSKEKELILQKEKDKINVWEMAISGSIDMFKDLYKTNLSSIKKLKRMLKIATKYYREKDDKRYNTRKLQKM